MTQIFDGEKYCARCLTWQPIDNYHKRGDGLHSYCRRCVSERKYELRHGAPRKHKRRTKAEIEAANV